LKLVVEKDSWAVLGVAVRSLSPKDSSQNEERNEDFSGGSPFDARGQNEAFRAAIPFIIDVHVG
jgi:hypothetical protein